MSIQTVLVEEATSPQVREVLERDFRVATLPLYALEYRSSDILKEGKEYGDLIALNLNHLSVAMECQK